MTTILSTPQGGTGTSTKPTTGQIPVGQSNGTYLPATPASPVTPGGADTDVQFNDGGTAFGGSSDFTFDKHNSRVFATQFTTDATGGNKREGFGYNSVVSGQNDVAVGNGWSISVDNAVGIGGLGQSIVNPGTTIINSPLGSGIFGSYGTAIGGAEQIGGDYSIQLGWGSIAGENGVVVGHNSTASPRGVSIGYTNAINYADSAAIGSGLTPAGSDQMVMGYTDTYFKNVTGDGTQTAYLHSADAGSNDQSGSDFYIQPGLGRGLGIGGTFKLKMNNTSGSTGGSFATLYDAFTMSPSGTATFIGADNIVSTPASPTGSIQYLQGSSGYMTDGSTSHAYTVYAYKTFGGTKVFSTPGVDLGTYVDDNSTVVFNDSPTNGSAGETAGAGYAMGDVVEYRIFGLASINGNALFTPAYTAGSVVITGATGDVNVGWTNSSYPASSSSNILRILRQVNGGGYNDYMDVPPTGSFTDSNVGWTSGSTVSPTVVQSFYQINLSYTASGSPDGYLILRSTNGGSADATDVGNVTSFTDTGALPWADSTTITPTTTPGTIVTINTSTGKALNVNGVYNLPNVDGSPGYAVTTNGSGQWGYTAIVAGVSGTPPIVSSGGLNPTISITDAAADGTTKGAAAFEAADFNASSGIISIDYTNAQAADATHKGFLTSSDWTTFNNKIGTVGSANLTGQSAAKTATTIFTPTSSGMYRVSVYLQVTTAASTSSVLGGATGVVITYNDGDGNVAQTDTVALTTTAGAIAISSATNTTATNLTGTLVVNARTGVAIQYAIGYTSVGVTAMQYAAHLRIEQI